MPIRVPSDADIAKQDRYVAALSPRLQADQLRISG
jgi:hypothetical protein